MQKSNTTSGSRPVKKDVNKMTRDDATKLYRDLGAQALSSPEQGDGSHSATERNRSRIDMAKLQAMKSPTLRIPQFPVSKVYSAMAPEEAAHLMEQLDISIALPLIQKMPEKRIGQILAPISPERALAITKLLSGRVGE